MEATLEERERAAPGVEISQVTREGLDELCGRGHERRDDKESEESERGERDHEDDRGCSGTAEPSSNQGFHGGVERHGEEGGDEHPRDCVQREVHEHQPEDRGRGDRHPDEN